MIRVMDDDLVAQIKAGEVIERPASAVKELIENAIDAGATRIRVEAAEGGTRLIRVVDNGHGIPPEQLALAFAQHTSSKLHKADDLPRVQTLGFRGEALYAIANVAHVEAISGVSGSEAAMSVVYEGGKLVSSAPVASAGGTRITVQDIFAHVPARRKHMKSARAEASALHQVVAQYVMGHPGVAIRYVADGRPVLESPGTGDLADAFGSVYGGDIAHRMLPVHREDRISVRGLVSPPDITRPNRTAILLLVNGRPVRTPALVFAIEDAYGDLLMTGRHALAVIMLEVPPEDLDPNVHPAKLDVRFVAERAAFSTMRSAVSDALRGQADGATVRTLERWPLDVVASALVRVPEPPRRPYPEQISFAPPPEEQRPSIVEALPTLRVFGQAARTFVVAEGPSGIYMIDQHAAHERVLFDQLMTRRNGRAAQPLLEPVQIDLLPHQWATLTAYCEDIRGLGIHVEPFGDTSCIVRALPAMGNRSMTPEQVGEVLDALSEARSGDEVAIRALTVVACKGAVKAGETLSMPEMQELIGLLVRTDHPRTCPHGRPTTVHISTERLEREFGRR